MPLMPLNRLAPRLQRSVEGLNLELEEVFVSEKTDDQHEVRPPYIYIYIDLMYLNHLTFMYYTVDVCL